MASYFKYRRSDLEFFRIFEELPTQAGFAVIFHDINSGTDTREYYYLVYSAEPWICGYDGGNTLNAKIMSKVANITAMYRCYVRRNTDGDVGNNVGTSWAKQSYNFGDETWAWEHPAYLLWTNFDICWAKRDEELYKSEGKTEYISTWEVKHEAVVPAPYAREPGIEEYERSATLARIVGENAAYWHNSFQLTCLTYPKDDGTLTVDWYKDGELVSSKVGTPGSYRSMAARFKPPDDEFGKFTYHAVVTNTINGVTASVICEPLTIEVVEFDWSKYDPDVGDTTGTITENPSYIGDEYPEYPEDPEDPEAVATPEQLRGAFWRGYATSKALYGGGI